MSQKQDEERDTVTAGGEENSPQQLICPLGNDVHSALGPLKVCQSTHVHWKKENHVQSLLGSSRKAKGEEKTTPVTDLNQRAQGVKAELQEDRANEAVDAFIIFTEDWAWSRLSMINPGSLIHLSIHPSHLPQSAGPLFREIKPAVIQSETEPVCSLLL